jgi:LPXTG-site transpeptidase (sortase) family protein
VTGGDWRVIRHRSGTRNLLVALAVLVVVGLVAGGAVLVRDDDDGRPATASGVAGAADPGPLTIEPAPATEPVQLPPPTQVRIPSIAVDSPLESLGVDAAGALKGPVDYAKAGWFEAGVVPGEIGPAVIAGHVDSAAGPAVFYRLRDLKAGDVIEVARGDKWIAFRVVASERYPKNQFPTERVYRPAPVPELRLITCGGTFDRTRRSYEDNIVVYAVAA